LPVWTVFAQAGFFAFWNWTPFLSDFTIYQRLS